MVKMSGGPMTLKVINETNGKLEFLYTKNSFCNTWVSKNAMQCSYILVVRALGGTLTLM